MNPSKMVAGVLAITIVCGTVYGLTMSGRSMPVSPEMVCSSDRLTFTQQNDCKEQLKAAKSEAGRKQVATDFQAKIDARKNGAAGNADINGASTSSGGAAMTPSNPSGA